ncbi:hypothetical protein LY76DRAFT_608824 [Colletotrichum caudatum]|nr:hypothetical protein LY76DRAFT_608824 [Colletotrichum caudatum]
MSSFREPTRPPRHSSVRIGKLLGKTFRIEQVLHLSVVEAADKVENVLAVAARVVVRRDVRQSEGSISEQERPGAIEKLLECVQESIPGQDEVEEAGLVFGDSDLDQYAGKASCRWKRIRRSTSGSFQHPSMDAGFHSGLAFSWTTKSRISSNGPPTTWILWWLLVTGMDFLLALGNIASDGHYYSFTSRKVIGDWPEE